MTTAVQEFAGGKMEEVSEGRDVVPNKNTKTAVAIGLEF